MFTDGRREYLQRTLASFDQMVTGDIGERWIFDDSADPAHQRWLHRAYGERFEIVSWKTRRGFGGTIHGAWEHLAERTEASHIAHLEEDFTFDVEVDLGRLVALLEAMPHLTQVALLRAAHFPVEIAAGGIIEQHPNAYQRRSYGGFTWMQHRRYFTTNPCVYRRELLDLGWPDVEASEQVFTRTAFRSMRARSAFWGDGTPWVSHIGAVRTGTGY